jgi:UDP-D-galactose:(glucosyl)LPS alpha-1,6-D-galactosyltransferase
MEKVSSIVIKELESRGDTVTLLLRRRAGDKQQWVPVSKYHEIATQGGWINRCIYCYKLTRQLKLLRPDVIIGLDPWAVLAARWYRYLRKDKVRIGSWIHFTLSAQKKKEQYFLQSADFHLAISSGIASQLKELPQRKKENIYTVFVPTKFVAEFIPRPAVPTFVFVGRLTFDGQKRVNDLLVALSNVKGEWKALIVGDGPDAVPLKELALELGIRDKIEWTGWVDHPWAAIKAASTLVLTSKYEGFPMVLIEALIRGVPCLSSDCPTGPADIIIPGENGWLYPLYDISRLTVLLQQIVDNPQMLPKQEVVKKSAERFTTEVVIDRMRNAILKEKVEKL